MKAKIILLFIFAMMIISPLSCTEESSVQEDIFSIKDAPSDIMYSDLGFDVDLRDVIEDSGEVLSDTGICDIKCPPHMHCFENRCVCDENFADCNNNEDDGCEADLTSTLTCGDCRNDCSKPMLGAEEFVCEMGLCKVSKCKEGRADCNKKGNDGCEVYLDDDPKNCGVCGLDCGDNSICVNGKCDCKSGFANCNLVLTDGCEKNISVDNENCGGCNKRCGENSFCSNGKCICISGYGDCNGSSDDGCETRLIDDKYHCGDCKNDCTKLPNVLSSKCDSGSCVIIDCLYGFGNCDNYNLNGCEVNFSTDPQHCGDCATNCHDNSICNNKQCGCKQDFANCNNNWGDGCEVNLSSVSTCGLDCNSLVNCNQNATCINHRCECIAPFSDCNKSWDDGCEVNTSNDRLNCGGCKSTCIKGNYYSGSCINSKCAGGYVYAHAYGSTGNDEGKFLMIDHKGNIIMAGSFSGDITIGGKTLYNKGGYDIFVARFTPDGLVLDIRSFGSPGDEEVMGLAVNQNGDIFLAGYFEADINFGGGLLKNSGNKDVFLLKLTNSLDYVWAKGFGSSGREEADAIVVDRDLNVIIGGTFTDTIQFENNTYQSYGESDIFLAKFTNDGRLIWSSAFGAPPQVNGYDLLMGIKADSSGNIYIIGGFSNVINFGGENLTTKGHYDIYLAKFDKNGTHQKSISMGSANIDLGLSLVINSKNEIVISGVFRDSIKIGNEELPCAGNMDILIAKFDSELNFIKARGFGSLYDDMAVLSLDKDDNILLTGSSKGIIKFGEESLTNKGDADIILVKLNSDLEHIFSYTFGSTGYDSGVGLTTDNSGNIYLTGSISGPVDFGGGDVSYPPLNLSDIFFAKFQP